MYAMKDRIIFCLILKLTGNKGDRTYSGKTIEINGKLKTLT